MKLSDAVRLGSMMKPQAFFGNDNAGTCALGAAAEAVGIPHHYSGKNYNDPDYGKLRMEFPILSIERDCPCGVCTFKGRLLMDIIWFLNDTHRWTRERIADYIETVEAVMPECNPPECDVCTTEPALRSEARNDIDAWHAKQEVRQ